MNVTSRSTPIACVIFAAQQGNWLERAFSLLNTERRSWITRSEGTVMAWGMAGAVSKETKISLAKHVCRKARAARKSLLLSVQRESQLRATASTEAI